MLVLSARTGLTEAVLLDNGYLTAVRTAAAGAVVAAAGAFAPAAGSLSGNRASTICSRRMLPISMRGVFMNTRREE